MTKILIILAILLALLMPITVGAHEEDRAEVVMQPTGHFLFAAASHYSLSNLCFKAFDSHSTRAKYGCRIASGVFIASVATWEKKNFEGFNSDDFWADIAGVGFSFMVLEF